MADSLKRYREKRDFKATSEPEKGGQGNDAARAFVVQKHWASQLHYDFRLELDGAMKSWAVPKGPTLDPTVKRMAVEVEDHPIAYKQFEGDIPKGQYGAGKVIIWDEGTWHPVGDVRKGLKNGHIKFDLDGVKLKGRWALIRMKEKDARQPPWLLIKEKDGYARPSKDYSVTDDLPDSVVPQRKQNTAGRIPGVETDMPETVKPQLATLATALPKNPADWIYETKFDGYRIMARVQGTKVHLFTRNGHDWTSKLSHIAEGLVGLMADRPWIDGEIVVLGAGGMPDFQALQNAFDQDGTDKIVFYAFDLLYVAGRDIRSEPVSLRRELLRQLIDSATAESIRFSPSLEVPPEDLWAAACRQGHEGLIAKLADSRYVSRRSEAWIKLKCGQRQEFVVVGYTVPRGARAGLGALLLAVHDEKAALRYAGKVGTGFDDRGLRELESRLSAMRVQGRPLDVGGQSVRGAIWVKPELIAEVSFASWTTGEQVRHAVFKGIRSDKPVKDIAREKSVEARKRVTKSRDASTSSRGKLSHPDRVIDPSTGLTKLDLARYYAQVAHLLIPHLKGRPVSFLRAPSGVHQSTFFQKHLDSAIPGVKALPKKLDSDHPALMEVPTGEALLAAAQMNVVEFHTWNAVKTAIAKPDRMMFDLDPGAGVKWSEMVQAADLMHVLLRELGLKAWLKTSGGKGLHVVVPVRKHYDWDTTKAFSQAIVHHLAITLPALFVAKSGPKNRVRKIFVDYLRNGFGATTVAAWSARARPGLGVSVPIDWDEAAELTSGAHWTITDIDARMAPGETPWRDYAPQPLTDAMSALGFDPRKKR